MDGGGIKDVMETYVKGIPPRRGDNHEAETRFHEVDSAEYAEFRAWKSRRAAEAAAAEAEKHEVECQAERERVAAEVYKHQVRRARRAFTRAARAALVAGALAATVAASVALLRDAYKEE
jgi:uncharacterized membrane protein YcjF (UPF0283 family)